MEKSLLSLLMLLSLSSCDLSFLENLINSNDIGSSNSNLESLISYEDYLSTQLTLVEDLKVSINDIKLYKVVSGPLNENGCYSVIEFKKGKDVGFIYNCSVKGYNDEIEFQVGFYQDKFLGYNNIYNNEVTSFGGNLINNLHGFLNGLSSKQTIEDQGYKEIITGTSMTGDALSKPIEACRNHYEFAGKDGTSLLEITANNFINEYYNKLIGSEEIEKTPHMLEEYGLVLKENHQIVLSDRNSDDYLIKDENDNTVAVACFVKSDDEVIIDIGHGVMGFLMDAYIAINIEDESIYGVALAKGGTSKPYSYTVAEWGNKNLSGLFQDDVSSVETSACGATYSATELKVLVEEAYTKYYHLYK